MIVCHCMQLTDRVVREVVREGAGCPEDVMQACGAGGECGGCQPLLEEIVLEERACRAHTAANVHLPVLRTNAHAT